MAALLVPPRRRARGLALVGLTLLAGWAMATPVARAQPAPAAPDWPQWRGPLASGVAPASDPPTQWSETQNVKWKVKLPGRGTASPIVWGNRIFIQTAIPTGAGAAAPAPRAEPAPPAAARGGVAGGASGGASGGPRLSVPPSGAYQFALLCLDRQTGQILWQRVAREGVPHEGHHPDGSFASNSPVTDGKLVFACFGSRGLYCYDLDGNPKWSKDLGQMQIKMGFGEGSSPALFGDTLVVNWDHEGGSFLLALDAATGDQRWRQSRDEGTSWATPLVVRHEGQTQVVTAATKKVRAYDLADGKLLWECAGLTANVIPSPVAADGVVYAISGYRGYALLAIRLGKTGDLTGTDAIAWRYDKATPYVPSPLLYGNQLYFFADNKGVLSCLDAKTGRACFAAQKVVGLDAVYASPVGAAGRVYLVGRNGATVVLRQGEQFEVLATNRLDEHFDASPAVAGRELFLRGREFLYCLAAP